MKDPVPKINQMEQPPSPENYKEKIFYRSENIANLYKAWLKGKIRPRKFEGNNVSTAPSGEKISFWFDEPVTMGQQPHVSIVLKIKGDKIDPEKIQKGKMAYKHSSIGLSMGGGYDQMSEVDEYYISDQIPLEDIEIFYNPNMAYFIPQLLEALDDPKNDTRGHIKHLVRMILKYVDDQFFEVGEEIIKKNFEEGNAYKRKRNETHSKAVDKFIKLHLDKLREFTKWLVEKGRSTNEAPEEFTDVFGS